MDGRQGGASLPGQLKQLEALPDAPDLILLTVGGNDVGFEDLATLCLMYLGCEDPGPLLPKGRDQLRTGLERMTPKLPTVYRSVTRVAAKRAGHPVPVLIIS